MLKLINTIFKLKSNSEDRKLIELDKLGRT